MKIVLDMNLSPSWKGFLEKEGYEVKHWSSIGSPKAADIEIMNWARDNGYLVFTHDLDFSTLLYVTKASFPSVFQIRYEDIRPSVVGKLVLEALKKAKKQIEQGAIITVDVRKSRIRLLPLRKKGTK